MTYADVVDKYSTASFHAKSSSSSSSSSLSTAVSPTEDFISFSSTAVSPAEVFLSFSSTAVSPAEDVLSVWKHRRDPLALLHQLSCLTEASYFSSCTSIMT